MVVKRNIMQLVIFFTASEEMKQILDKVSDIEDGFPFSTVIESEAFDVNKIKYRFT